MLQSSDGFKSGASSLSAGCCWSEQVVRRFLAQHRNARRDREISDISQG